MVENNFNIVRKSNLNENEKDMKGNESIQRIKKP